MIKLPGLIVIAGLWPKKGWGRPLLCVFTPNAAHSFVQKDNKGKIVWYERTWSDSYKLLA